MAKITQVTIIDEKTLRLDVNALKGDEIDLLALNQIDTSILKQKIDERKDTIYEKRLQQEKELFEANKNNELEKLRNKLKEEYQVSQQKLELQLQQLTTTKELLEKSIEEKAKLMANEEVKAYTEKMQKIETESRIEIARLTQQLQLEREKQKQVESQNKIEILNQEKKWQDQLYQKEQEINQLKLNRGAMNIKRIGEDLEKWCDNQYYSYAQIGFSTCTWEKDNTPIKDTDETKGTKADFIFKVYATTAYKEEELLTSVACEMKSEDPNSINKKTNASHFAKLDKDRKKKKCEYALLVSELEWDQINDVPIRRVKEYENMYIVRPAYFITFLSIIENLGMKYQELILENQREALQFEEAQVILDKFNQFKNDIITKTIEKIAKEVTTIQKNAQTIRESSDKILISASHIIDTQLENLKKKINQFQIDKIVKSIDKLDINPDE